MNLHQKLYNHINILSINGGNFCVLIPQRFAFYQKKKKNPIVQYPKYLNTSSFPHPKELLNTSQRHLLISNTAWFITFFLKEKFKGWFYVDSQTILENKTKPKLNPDIFHSSFLELIKSLVYLYVINYERTLCKITPITLKKVNPYLFTSTVKTLHKTHSSGK